MTFVLVSVTFSFLYSRPHGAVALQELVLR